MMHPFPAEHDQQQAKALDLLREAKAFILVCFEQDERECNHPLCAVLHQHHSTSIVASCSNSDLHAAVEALSEEIALTTSLETLMRLSPAQREQIAEMLTSEKGAFFPSDDDEA